MDNINTAQNLNQDLTELSKRTFFWSSNLTKKINEIYQKYDFKEPIPSETAITILKACQSLKKQESRLAGIWSRIFGKPSYLSKIEQNVIAKSKSPNLKNVKEFLSKTLQSLEVPKKQAELTASKIYEKKEIECISPFGTYQEFLSVIARYRNEDIPIPEEFSDLCTVIEKTQIDSLNSDIQTLNKHLDRKISERTSQANHERQKIILEAVKNETKHEILNSVYENILTLNNQSNHPIPEEITKIIKSSRYSYQDKERIVLLMNALQQSLRSLSPTGQKKVWEKIQKDLPHSRNSSKLLNTNKVYAILNKALSSLYEKNPNPLIPIPENPPSCLYIGLFKLSLNSLFNQHFNLLQTEDIEKFLSDNHPIEKLAFIENFQEVCSSFHDASEEDLKKIIYYIEKLNNEDLGEISSENIIYELENTVRLTPSKTKNPNNQPVRLAQRDLAEYYDFLNQKSKSFNNEIHNEIFKDTAKKFNPEFTTQVEELQKNLPSELQPHFLHICTSILNGNEEKPYLRIDCLYEEIQKNDEANLFQNIQLAIDSIELKKQEINKLIIELSSNPPFPENREIKDIIKKTLENGDPKKRKSLKERMDFADWTIEYIKNIREGKLSIEKFINFISE